MTIGSIASALLGVSASFSSRDDDAINPLRTVGLVLLAVAILFCAYALKTFRKRAELLNARAGKGFDDTLAPLSLSFVLVVSLGAVYVSYILQHTAIKV